MISPFDRKREQRLEGREDRPQAPRDSANYGSRPGINHNPDERHDTRMPANQAPQNNSLDNSQKSKVERELKSIIMLYLEEKTPLTRKEMREDILRQYYCPLPIYIDVEKRTLKSTYSSWVNDMVVSPERIKRDRVLNLARLLERDLEADLKIREREGKQPIKTLIYSIFWLDQFYLGEIWLGILKFLTLGYFVIGWPLGIIFAVSNTKRHNAQLLEKYI